MSNADKKLSCRRKAARCYVSFENCVKSIFTARCYCIALTMPSQNVCLSFCHTPVFCRNGQTYPQSFFHHW